MPNQQRKISFVFVAKPAVRWSYLDAVSHQVSDILLAAAFQAMKEEVPVLLHLNIKQETDCI